jgi:four helix bundle protein
VKSSKFQAPSSREASIVKLQSQEPTLGSVAWWEEEPLVATMVLKDEGPERQRERHPFDLEERTTDFGEKVIRFSKKIPRDPTNNRLIDQLVGCGTSVGANYCEANEGVSKKDFHHIIGRCVKEAKETKFFLRMVVASEPQLTEEARALYREAKELHLIFASIYRK